MRDPNFVPSGDLRFGTVRHFRLATAVGEDKTHAAWGGVLGCGKPVDSISQNREPDDHFLVECYKCGAALFYDLDAARTRAKAVTEKRVFTGKISAKDDTRIREELMGFLSERAFELRLQGKTWNQLKTRLIMNMDNGTSEGIYLTQVALAILESFQKTELNGFQRMVNVSTGDYL